MCQYKEETRTEHKEQIQKNTTKSKKMKSANPRRIPCMMPRKQHNVKRINRHAQH